MNVDKLARIIREVDGNHSLGAGALAEAILGHPDYYPKELHYTFDPSDGDVLAIFPTRKMAEVEAEKCQCYAGTALFAKPKVDQLELLSIEPSGGIVEQEFEMFWKEYPRKVGKRKAFSAFKSALKRVQLSELMTALENHKNSIDWKKDEGKFIPHATTWLNGDRWEDEIELESKQLQFGSSWIPENWREVASEISGQDCSRLAHWQELPLEFQFPFEKHCREVLWT